MVTWGHREAGVRLLVCGQPPRDVVLRWEPSATVADLLGHLGLSGSADEQLDSLAFAWGDEVVVGDGRCEVRSAPSLQPWTLPPRPVPPESAAAADAGPLREAPALPLWPTLLSLLPAVGMLLVLRDPRLLVLVIAAPLATIAMQLAQRRASRRSDAHRRRRQTRDAGLRLDLERSHQDLESLWWRAAWPPPDQPVRVGSRQREAWAEAAGEDHTRGDGPILAVVRLGGGSGSRAGRPVVLPVSAVTVIEVDDAGAGPDALLALARWLLVQVLDQAPGPVSCIQADATESGVMGQCWTWLDLTRRWQGLSAGWQVQCALGRVSITSTTSAGGSPSVVRVEAGAAGIGKARTAGGDATSFVLEGLSHEEAQERLRALVAAPLGQREACAPFPVALSDLAPVVTLPEVERAWELSGTELAWRVGMDRDRAMDVDLTRSPHVLVAGTTGSGKSEALQALLLDLARRYPPERLVAVVVDCKGGSSLQPVAGLPHVLDVVTDVDGELLGRALRSVSAEIRSRAELLRAEGWTELGAWWTHHLRRRGPAGTQERQQQGRVPPPDLLVVVDEFAVLATERPDLLDALVDLGRRGRSLGVHLVLATQSVTGVVSGKLLDNIDVRLVLRLADAAQSQLLVGDDAAARLPSDRPGAALLAVGSSKPLSVQLPWVGAPLRRMVPVQIVPLGEETAGTEDTGGRGGGQSCASGRETSQGAELVEAVAAAQARRGRAVPRAPWQPPLPAVWRPGVPLADRVEVALLDLPERQQQLPVTVDLTDPPGLLVLGSAGSGRSSLLRTLVTLAARSRLPEDYRMAIVDGVGSPLAGLHGLPHVAAVVDPADEDHLALVVRRLLEPARPGSRRLLVVDDLGQLLRQLERPAAAHLHRRFETLLLTGRAAGVGLALAATSDNDLPVGLRRRLDLTVSLEGAQRPGRGWLDGHELQVAITDGTSPEPAFAGTSRTGTTPRRDPRWRPLPVRLPWEPPPWMAGAPGDADDADDADNADADADAGDGRLVLGLTEDGPFAVSLDSDGPLLVAGAPRSGRSTALRLVARAAAQRGQQLHLVAPRRSPLVADPGWAAVEPPENLPRLATLLHQRRLGGPPLVVVDDADLLLDPLSDVAQAMTELLLSSPERLHLVVALSEQRAARGLTGWPGLLRAWHHAVLLAPSPLAREVFPELDLGRLPATRVPGRGVLVRPGAVAAVAQLADPGPAGAWPCDTDGPRSGPTVLADTSACGQPRHDLRPSA